MLDADAMPANGRIQKSAAGNTKAATTTVATATNRLSKGLTSTTGIASRGGRLNKGEPALNVPDDEMDGGNDRDRRTLSQLSQASSDDGCVIAC